MAVDGEAIVAGAGDVVVIEPETPHGFIAIGDTHLEMICIHASDRFIIEWLDNR